MSQVVATGGTVTDINVSGTDYRVHTFTTSDDFIVTGGGTVEYLIVAGGAGGGNTYAGGGGGGFASTGSTAVTSQTYSVVVGGGGVASATNHVRGTNGSNSSALSVTSEGGGGGGGGTSPPDQRAGANGGCGGGSGNYSPDPGGTGSQGGDGGRGNGANPEGGGGGGGAGGNGQDGVAATGGNGGVGITSSITGTSVGYGGGGGGGADKRDSGNAGGTGVDGGGKGGDLSSLAANGTNGRGGGGGGGSHPLFAGPASDRVGGAGGSGIVIIRYVLFPPAPTGPWRPDATVTLDNGDYTGETLRQVLITRGRRSVYEVAPAGYCRLQLIDLVGTGLPIDIAQTLDVTVKNTLGDDVTVFSGYVTDIAADLYDPGIGGTPAAIYSIIAVGPLARLSRRVVLDGGRPSELDGTRITAALSTGLAVTWEELPNGDWDALDPTLTWETFDPGYDPTIIDPGIFTLAALDATDSGYTALEVAEEASRSGAGYLYETLDGRVGWANADSRGTATAYLDIPNSVIGSNGLRSSASISNLVNRVTVTYDGGAETSQDSASIQRYTLFSRRISTTLANASNASDRADEFIERHAYPAINLDSFSIRLDTLTDDTLIDELLEVYQNTPVNLTGLPATLGYTQIPGFVEGTTLTLDRHRADLRLTVSDATLSFGSIRWSAIPQSLVWDDLPATLTWEDARSL